MKKAYFSILIVLIIGIVSQSCEVFIGSATDDFYYLSIIGDSGRQVKVSYYERTPNFLGYQTDKLFTENVTLPFFKQVHFNIHTDVHICSKNDSTTKAIVFDNYTKLADAKCFVYQVYYPENATLDCQYCKTIYLDSVMRNLKSINYPCYMEFSKSDESRVLNMNLIWNNKRFTN